MTHHIPARLALTGLRTTPFSPGIANPPPLPAVDWASLGTEAPELLPTPPDTLPDADVVVITWAGAEWSALEHVFCASVTPMPYSYRDPHPFPDWPSYAEDLAPNGPPDWTYWGYHRLVSVGGRKVLLFKSNTHLDWPGRTFLEALIERLIEKAQPKLVLSVGTAGGANSQDHLGTVRLVSAGTLYAADTPSSAWTTYQNSWPTSETKLTDPRLPSLLYPIPTSAAQIEAIRDAYARHSNTSYRVAELDPDGLCLGDLAVQVAVSTDGTNALLTATSFLVGTLDNRLSTFACIEMDDAVIDGVCAHAQVAFGSVRNLSDPAQNQSLPPSVQSGWGHAVYEAFGLYTSYNGAIATWAALATR